MRYRLVYRTFKITTPLLDTHTYSEVYASFYSRQARASDEAVFPAYPRLLISYIHAIDPSKGVFPSSGPVERVSIRIRLLDEGVRSHRARYPGDSLGTHPAGIFRLRRAAVTSVDPGKQSSPSAQFWRRPRYYRFQSFSLRHHCYLRMDDIIMRTSLNTFISIPITIITPSLTPSKEK